MLLGIETPPLNIRDLGFSLIEWLGKVSEEGGDCGLFWSIQ